MCEVCVRTIHVPIQIGTIDFSHMVRRVIQFVSRETLIFGKCVNHVFRFGGHNKAMHQLISQLIIHSI